MGLATAQLLSTRGAIISLADINQEGLKTAVQSLTNSEKHIFTVVDVRSSQSVDSWIASTVQKLGRLDGAVNMAGVITTATPITEVTDDNWNFSFDVNARGVFYCVRAQLRAMSDGASIVRLPLSGNPDHQKIHTAKSICIPPLSNPPVADGGCQNSSWNRKVKI